jgi:hypothetical protein
VRLVCGYQVLWYNNTVNSKKNHCPCKYIGLYTSFVSSNSYFFPCALFHTVQIYRPMCTIGTILKTRNMPVNSDGNICWVLKIIFCWKV